MRRIVIVSHDLTNNAAGRAHVIWTLARHLGIEAVVGGLARGPIWPPLRGSTMVEHLFACRSVSSFRRELLSAADQADVIVSIKTWPRSLGLALDTAARCDVPLLADIDDPDHAALVGQWARPVYRRAFRARMRLQLQSPRQFDALQGIAATLPRMVSNPTMQELYGGGVVVPHARSIDVRRPDDDGGNPLRIAFVGTPRAHKGLPHLREAVARISGARLTITAPPPRDRKPWEDWVGPTSLTRGKEILRSSNVVVVPQAATGYGRAQLPAKLIDAMAAGKAIVASATEPIEWALAGSGITVPPGDPRALRDALTSLLEPFRRRELAAAALARAQERFGIEAVAPSFAEALALVQDSRHS